MGGTTPRFLAASAAALMDSGIRLRAALPEDQPFLAELYASTRADELLQVPWGDEQKKAFTDWQSGLQEAHYAAHYPRAERLVIEGTYAGGGSAPEATATGRIYIDTTDLEVRLMDITLLPVQRNQGTGMQVVNALLHYADALRRPVSLHVESFNPAKRMYERVGFVVSETRGLYEFMIRAIPGDRPGVS